MHTGSTGAQKAVFSAHSHILQHRQTELLKLLCSQGAVPCITLAGSPAPPGSERPEEQAVRLGHITDMDSSTNAAWKCPLPASEHPIVNASSGEESCGLRDGRRSG